MFSTRNIILAVSIALLFPSFAFVQAQSNDPCPGQGHRSTGQGSDAGFPVGVKICPSDSGQKTLFGGCEYNPYEILESQYRGGNVQITPSTNAQGTPVGGINSALACRLTKLFKAAEERNCKPRIISAYRSAQQQENMCGAGRSGCAPAGKSCHQYGLAIDVSATCVGWLRMAAPQFQLVFPYYGNHIKCAEHSVASCSVNTPPCNGSVGIQPDLSRLPRPDQVPETYYVPPSAPPSSGIANQFRQALGMPTQPMTSISNTPVAQQTPSIPQPEQSKFCIPEYKCSGNTLMFQNSFCAVQTSQVCSAGCTNGACINAATSTASTTPADEPRASSTLEMLEFLSGAQASSVDVGTSTPLQLLLSLTTDQVRTQVPTTTRATTSIMGNVAYMSAQQTFVSADLSQNYSLSQQPIQSSTTGFFVVLENLKVVLLRTLEYIRPFSPQRYATHAHVEVAHE